MEFNNKMEYKVSFINLMINEFIQVNLADCTLENVLFLFFFFFIYLFLIVGYNFRFLKYPITGTKH